MSSFLQELFKPVYLGRMELKNRLVMAPMTTNYAAENGFVTEKTKAYYEARARGGVGLIILEATSVESPRGKARDYGLAIDDDKFIPGFHDLAQTVQKHNTKVVVQLFHAGAATRTCITHMQPVSASPIQIYDKSRKLSTSEIEGIIVKFAQAAVRAKKAGLDGVEIHAAAAYLFAQFLSPKTNKRQDMYGGSLENRARFLINALCSIKELTGKDYPVWCRINGQEFGIEDGFTLEEAKQLSKMLEKAGADAVHVAGMGFGDYLGYGGATMYDPPANLAYHAEAVKKEVTIPVIAVGRISLQDGERLVQDGKADLIAIGRPLLTDPDLLNKAREGKLEDIRPCLRCRVCDNIILEIKRSGIRCVVNATLGHEREYSITEAEHRRRILVIGGGPGGMETARVAALRGHDVILYDKKPYLGGQMELAAVPPCKEPIRDFTNYLIEQIERLHVHVELGKEVNVSLVKQMKPDVAVLATGGTSLTLRIPGYDSSNVVAAEDVLMRSIDVGKRVTVIGGGLVGCETADFLSENGKEVTVLEMLQELAITLSSAMRARLIARLISKKVVMMTGVNVRGISGRGVDVVDGEGHMQFLECDTVVLAIGFEANRSLAEALGQEGIETYLIGDCVERHSILEAVADGFRVGSSL